MVYNSKNDGKGLTDRRAFLKMAGAAWAATLAPQAAFALSRTDAVYASAFMAPDGAYGVATLTEAGEIVERVPLPARAHGLTYAPVSNRAVAFARRPGTYAMIFAPDRSAAPVVIAAAEGRHFFGHGCFSADGRMLYATENDFAANRGMIGVYDGTAGFARIAEFPSYGIGPHDMALTADGRMLVIANGGIETHPDFGRTKLNLDRMEPSLVLIDTASGGLIERHAMPDTLRRLSTRHLAIDAEGRIWFACQYEGPRNDLPPLVGSFARGEDIRFLPLPDAVTAGLANYIGAIAVNRHEGLVGLTSPKGGLFVTVNAETGAVVAQTRLPQAAGIAPSVHGLVASSYNGLFAQTPNTVAWDQHIVRLGRE